MKFQLIPLLKNNSTLPDEIFPAIGGEYCEKKGMDEIDEIKTFLIHEEFINASESLT
jgi:hypothetical protein